MCLLECRRPDSDSARVPDSDSGWDCLAGYRQDAEADSPLCYLLEVRLPKPYPPSLEHNHVQLVAVAKHTEDRIAPPHSVLTP